MRLSAACAGYRSRRGTRSARRCADWLGWDYDEQAGDPGLLRALLAGDWDDGRFLVLPAGHTPRLVTDGRVIEAAAADAHGAAG